jgi:hypothetical protein
VETRCSDHGVAHFHAPHGDDEAAIEIATGDILGGSLSPRPLRLVRAWTELHRSELLDAWRKASNGEPPGTIEPLP